MNLPWSNKALVVRDRTYLRTDNGRRETWQEAAQRVVAGNVKNHNVSGEEIKQLETLMLDRKAMLAGRGLWYSGSPSHDKLGSTALNNCWFTTAEEYTNFVMAQDLLMLGGGVGLSIEHRFVSKLPKVKRGVSVILKNTADADFIIPDSRTGWNDLTHRLLESFFKTGKSFTYSTVCVRSAGEPIKGFGGTASGPVPFISMVEKISEILKSREGKHIRPIDAMDIICAIGEMVVSGNVRRSAILIMGDPWDKEYLKSKRWDLGPIPTQRAMANLSVVVDDVEDLHPLFWQTYEQGEPFGIVNRTNIRKYGRMGELKKDTAMGMNPCQPAFAPIATDTGLQVTMGELKIGDRIQTGYGYCAYGNDGREGVCRVVNKWSTGIKQVFSYVCEDGSNFIGTANHRVVIDSPRDTNFKAEIDDAFNHGLKIRTRTNGFVKIIARYYLGEHEVFDITVDNKEHTYLTGGIVASNCAEATLEDGEPCNLQELFLPNLTDVPEFISAAKLMHRAGKRITCGNFHNSKNDEVVKRNRRVGTGITGCLQAPQFFNANVLDDVYREIQRENIQYSQELNIPESIRTTVVKPSGTLSLLGDVTPGIHPSYSRYYIRRIRFSATDKLIPSLKAAGHNIEPTVRFDGTLDHNTLVVDFFCETPENTPCADEGFDTQKQLDTLLFAQKHWADQAVSVTVYYKKTEIDKIKIWLVNNLKNVKSISFLCHNDHGFKQAPLEAVTKEEYEKATERLKNLQIDGIVGEELESLECGSGFCPIK